MNTFALLAIVTGGLLIFVGVRGTYRSAFAQYSRANAEAIAANARSTLGGASGGHPTSH